MNQANAKRPISLTARASETLRLRMAGNDSSWIFPGEGKTEGVAFLATALNLPTDFVLHSLRYTFLTRLGEAGVDTFTIMRIAGHNTITVSQKYVHPSLEAMERAFERLESLNAAVESERTVEQETPEKNTLRATVSATLPEPISSSVR